MNKELTHSERLEMLCCLIETVEDWLTKKGITVKDIPNDERTEDGSLIYGSDYGYLEQHFEEILIENGLLK